MITLFSYPELFGLEDNNPYGLKVFAFLKLCGLPFDHRHILDTKSAPRGQLPYIVDDEESIGDSDAIVAHLKRKYSLTIDGSLTNAQQDLHLLIRRTLDDLYWVMSYSRWRDPRFWPLFKEAFLKTHSGITADSLDAAQKFNFERYHYQGIGRFEPDEAYARGIADLQAIANLLGDNEFMFGPEPGSIDASVYGFVANVFFYDIDTPLKQFVLAQPNLVRHCHAVRVACISRNGH
ncbi:glutathione S-transferase N-terminal domain-containing protein [Caballeronia sp. SEWSISQ10-4 2]|uniref:glutathione S-transferase C-terminal domain-containing protein n=1 Tax=Caballeronia sp. SEWSISQ10-4 2 TaxID=2937438 RepID=UPI0026514A23|nr:glutathione S-transferase C-terminal domain-containing protein [Caballeronia sp. SEWSISQ10-4 2]MDN7180040.1 glutathione S-transferase N-terminal domain-containing protein [Caballeronia sp. SEWSISQ10-4 2]